MAPTDLQEIVRRKLPQLFKGHTLCAGTDIGIQGSCKGDSGGPLMNYQQESDSWVQIATVQGGGVSECRDADYPGIYVRLDHSLFMSFILSVIEKTRKGNI